jgi:HD-like signal output (HDOD) protein
MPTAVTDQELAAAVEELPPVSAVLQRILVVLEDPDSDLDDISRLVRAETALSAQVLRLANSAYFGLPERVASVEQGIQQIGASQLNRLVSSLGSRRLFLRPLAQYDLTAEVLWQHTLAVAVCAETIAPRVGADSSAAYLAGILHPIGIVALDRVAAGRHLPPRTGHFSMPEWERDHFATDNALAAGRVLRHWKFPEPLAVAVAARYEAPTPSTLEKTGSVLHLASCLAERLELGLPPEGGLFRLNDETIEAYGLSPDDFAELEMESRQNLARTRTLLQLA